MDPLSKKVCVIGAGWSGLYALKTYIEEGFTDVTLFEKTDSVGGVWVYREDTPGNFPLLNRCFHTQSSIKSPFDAPGR